MNRIQAVFAATVCLAIMQGSVAFAQSPTTIPFPRRPLPSPTIPRPGTPTARPGTPTARPGAAAGSVTASQKAASDQSMRTALTQLQSASGAMQSGNRAQVTSDLQSALQSLYQAMPIYKSHRDHAVRATIDAYDAIKRRDYVRQSKQIALQISIATREINSALSMR